MSEFFKINIVDIFQIVIGLGTLTIALLVFKKLLPGELKKRQLKAVLDLIEHLNHYTFNMYTLYYQEGSNKLNASSNYCNRTLWSYCQLVKEKDYNKTDNTKIVITDKNYQPFDFSEYIENPILPPSIVEHLYKFVNGVVHSYHDRDYRNEQYIMVMELGSGLDYEKSFNKEQFYHPTAPALQSHTAFISSLQALIESIEFWCNNHGLKELNFRTENSRRIFN